VRDAYRRLVEQGWTDALRALHPGERIYTFWKYFRNAFAPDAGLRIDHLLLSPALPWPAAWLLPVSTVMCGHAKNRAITRRYGSNLRTPMPSPAGGALWSGSRLSVIGDQVPIGRWGRNRIELRETPVDWGMHPPGYYREQAERARRLAGLTHQSEMTEMLERMAEARPAFFSTSGSPTPDSCSRCGEPIAPAERITSRVAETRSMPDWRENSTPAARLPSNVPRCTNALVTICKSGRFFGGRR
jgi:hypothetical protein